MKVQWQVIRGRPKVWRRDVHERLFANGTSRDWQISVTEPAAALRSGNLAISWRVARYLYRGDKERRYEPMNQCSKLAAFWRWMTAFRTSEA